MDASLITWFGIVVAGALAGSFTIPAKKIRELSWNQSWLNCLLALSLLPLLLAAVLSPEVLRVIGSAPRGEVLTVFGFGILWGVGSRFFSLAIACSGFAVANTLVCGIVACIGSAGPLILGTGSLRPDEILPLSLGLTILCLGIGLCGLASHFREAGSGGMEKKGHAVWGIVLCLFAGLFSAMINYSFAAGAGMISAADRAGVHPALTTLAVWVPALLGGFLLNAGSSLFLMIRAGETARYKKAPAGDWLRGFSMGAIFFLSLMIYGVFSLRLGPSGAIFGWATYMGLSIATSAVWGFTTSEWKTAPQRARRFMLGGVILRTPYLCEVEATHFWEFSSGFEPTNW